MKSIENNFTTFISNKSCLVKFGAEWCGPCQAIKPTLETLENETGVDVYDVDIDQHIDIATDYSIRSIPTVIAFKNGHAVGQLTGSFAKDAYSDLINKVTG